MDVGQLTLRGNYFAKSVEHARKTAMRFDAGEAPHVYSPPGSLPASAGIRTRVQSSLTRAEEWKPGFSGGRPAKQSLLDGKVRGS